MKTEALLNEPEAAIRALRDSEQRYARLLGSSTQYVFSVRIAPEGGSTTAHGPGCEAVTGYTAGEFEANPNLWYEIIQSEDRSAVLTHIASVMTGKATPPLEHQIRHKSGQIRWIRNTAIPHKDEQGRVVSYDGLITDITQQKCSERLLRMQCLLTSELAHSSSLAEVMPRVLQRLCDTFEWDVASYWGVARGGQTLHCEVVWHRAGERLEVLDKTAPCSSLAPGAGLPGRVCMSGEPVWIADFEEETVLQVPPWVAEVGLRSACGFPLNRGALNVGVIELYGRLVRHPDPHMLEALVATGTQISQFVVRKQAEDSLEAERQLLRTLVDLLPDCVYVKDTESRFLMSNPAHRRVLGAGSLNEILGRTDFDFFPLEFASRYREDEVSLFESGQPLINREEPVRFADGSHRWVLTTKVPLMDGKGGISGLVGISRDITEQKAAEDRIAKAYADLAASESTLKQTVEELNRSHEELKSAQLQLIQAAKLESVGTLAAGVAHEVKNPLQTLLLGVEFLVRNLPEMSDDVRTALNEMGDAVRRANAIISEMLQFSAATDFRPTAEDLNAVLERALWLIKTRLVTARVTVVRDLAVGLPPVPVDARKLEQAFINLLINAVDAMPGGGPLRVSTRLVRVEPEMPKRSRAFQPFAVGEFVVVVGIQDRGVGIPEKNLARLFDPFFTTRPPGVGTGLGLSIVRNIVQLHGGTIDIRNVAEGGVCATLALRTQPLSSDGQETHPDRGR